jgi:hypothetical protein
MLVTDTVESVLLLLTDKSVQPVCKFFTLNYVYIIILVVRINKMTDVYLFFIYTLSDRAMYVKL